MIDPRDRITGRVNRARLELEVKRSVRPALIVLACVALGLALAAYAVSQVSPSALSKTRTASFELRDATGVVAGIDEVRFKGIPVGKVKDIAFRGTQAVATVQYRRSYGQIFRDARAELRPTTALQDMYLDVVDRGTPGAGVASEDDPVPATRTTVPVNISDVLNMFAPSQRVRMRQLLDDLGNGTADRGRSLRAVFVNVVPFLRQAGQITDALAARRPLVAQLVHDTAQLTGAIGDRETQLRRLVREGGTTVATLSAGRGDLDATLRGLPPVLTKVRSSFAAVDGVLGDVDGAVASLRPVAKRLGPALGTVQELGTTATPAVRALQRPVTRLTPLAQQLDPLSRSLADGLRILLPQVPTVNKVTKTAAGCKTGIQGFFQWNASMSKFGDSRGPIPRGNVTVGAQSSGVFKDPLEYAPQSCAPGRVIGGRLPTAKDAH